jgi:hypothetical protein
MKFLLLPVLLVGLASAAPINGPSDAADLVMNTMLLDMNKVEVRVLPNLLEQGSLLGAWSYPGVFVPFQSYLVLIDDYALANWEHPCRWVFVSPQGETHVERMYVPPDLYGRMSVEYSVLPDVSELVRGQYEDFIAWFEPNVQATPEQGQQMYAWIISGGHNMSNNHIRYYGDVQFIYNVLVYDYLIPKDQIIVCFADGTDPAPDQSGGLNSNPDFDNDGDTDINYNATLAGVTSGFNDIKAMVGPDDHLFVFTTDHGGSGKGGRLPPEVHLNLWNTQILNDDDFMVMLDQINAASIHVVMEQCYSGGFMEEVIHAGAAQPRTFASAANGYEYSWAGNTFPQYDEYVYWWTGAVHGSTPPAGSYPGGALPGNPDMNGDGYVSMWEAYDRGKAWDAYAQSGQEHPQWNDIPDSCGELYFLGGPIPVSIEDGTIEVNPAVGLSVSANPVSESATVSFHMNTTATARLEILDMAGRVVDTVLSGIIQRGGQSVLVDFSRRPAGIYMVRLATEGYVETMKVVRF